MEAMIPRPYEKMVATAHTSRMIVGSISRCIPIPAHTPLRIRSFFDRYNRFMENILFLDIKDDGKITILTGKS
jgi:hypothetical protein